MIHPTAIIDDTVTIDPSAHVWPYCVITGTSTIGENVVIEPHSYIVNSHIWVNTRITKSAKISLSTIGHDCKIGCEVRKAHIGNFVKASHTTILIENVETGNNINFGGSFTAAMYDGKQKRKLIIGDNVFIGTHVIAIPPSKQEIMRIGSNTFVAAGIQLRHNVPDHHTVYPAAIASRTKEEIIYQNDDYAILKRDKMKAENLLNVN